MSNIFQLSDEYRQLMMEIEDNEGDLTPDLEQRLKINEENFANKMDAYANIIALKSGDIQVIKDEVTRLGALQKTKEKNIEKLKNIMIEAIKLYGTTGKTGNKTYKTTLHSYWTVNLEKLKIADDAIIPNSYKKYTVSGTLSDDDKEELNVLISDSDLDVKLNYTEGIELEKLKHAVRDSGVKIEGVELDKDACYIRIK